MASGGRHGPDPAVSLQELIGKFYCSVSSFFKWIVPVIGHGCFISTIYWKYRLLSIFFADGLHDWGILWVIPLEFGFVIVCGCFVLGCVQFYGWWFFQWKSIDKSSFHVWWCGPLSFFVHYMKSSFEELLRDLQIISKELFLSSWNLVSATNLNTAKNFPQ